MNWTVILWLLLLAHIWCGSLPLEHDDTTLEYDGLNL